MLLNRTLLFVRNTGWFALRPAFLLTDIRWNGRVLPAAGGDALFDVLAVARVGHRVLRAVALEYE